MSKLFLVTKTKCLVGTLQEYTQGWKFFPNNACHKPSKKYHNDANAAIPAWAFNLSDNLLDADEFKRLSLEGE